MILNFVPEEGLITWFPWSLQSYRPSNSLNLAKPVCSTLRVELGGGIINFWMENTRMLFFFLAVFIVDGLCAVNLSLVRTPLPCITLVSCWIR